MNKLHTILLCLACSVATGVSMYLLVPTASTTVSDRPPTVGAGEARLEVPQVLEEPLNDNAPKSFVLIDQDTDRILDVAATPFPVAPGFRWVEAPIEKDKVGWTYDTNAKKVTRTITNEHQPDPLEQIRLRIQELEEKARLNNI